MKLALVFLSLGTYMGAVLAFITQVLLARTLTPEAFGEFQIAISFILMLTPLASFGVGFFWLRVFGEEGWQALRWIGPSLKFTLLSSATVVIFIFLWAILLPQSEINRNLLLILSFTVIGQAALDLGSAIFQLEERYGRLALWQFLPSFIKFIGLVVLCFFVGAELSAFNAAVVYSSAYLLTIVAGWFTIRKVYMGGLKLVGHGNEKTSSKVLGVPSSLNVLSQSWPFGLSGFFYFLYFQSGIVIIGYMLGENKAAQYSVAITILLALYLFPNLVYQKLLFPRICRWINKDKVKLVSLYNRGNMIMLFLGLIAALFIYFFSPYIIPIVFGESYVHAVDVTCVLALSVPFRYLIFSVGSFLASGENMKIKLKYMVWVGLLVPVLGYVSVDKYGFLGFAYVAVLADIVLLYLYYHAVKKVVLE